MRVYEICTVPWLVELSERYGRKITLDSVPDWEWDALLPYHFDAVWLMGVWCRSPKGQTEAQSTKGVVGDCRRVVPGFSPSRDVGGSAYSVKAYTPDPRVGGVVGLAAARGKLKDRKLKLILDFVPNHTAPDHDWVTTNPEYYVRGSANDANSIESRFFRAPDGSSVAYGASAFDFWRDTAQLNAFSPQYRSEAVATLNAIGDYCDGVRCDMAMLALDDVFEARWGQWAGAKPSKPFWSEVIAQVRHKHSHMVFIAEAYWDSEWKLQQQGFDFCYDKERLYERFAHGNADSIRQHLSAPLDYQRKLIRFSETHDEKPASECFVPQERQWMAAIAVATLPGASLFYDQQMEGRWGRLPVQLNRPVSVRSFYRRLLAATNRPAIQKGEWSMCQVAKAGSMIAWCWRKDEDRVLVVLNVSEDESTWGEVAVPWKDLHGRTWKLCDLLTDEEWPAAQAPDGLFHVKPRRWGADLFALRAVT